MKETKDTCKFSLGICDVATIVLLILKWCGLIEVSYWICFAPVLIPFAIVLVIAIIIKLLE